MRTNAQLLAARLALLSGVFHMAGAAAGDNCLILDEH
jgi:hypothetical protein